MHLAFITGALQLASVRHSVVVRLRISALGPRIPRDGLRALSTRAAIRSSQALIKIQNATFYDEHPSNSDAATNPPLFPNLSLYFEHTSRDQVGKPHRQRHWAVIGANPTPFLKVLKGDYIADPPNSRTYPYLSSEEIANSDPRLRIPSQAIQYVGFSGSGAGATQGLRGAYLSARYESRREETDWTVSQYLRGDTELNPSDQPQHTVADEALFARVVRDLRLEKLFDMPVSNLSNGQTRRSRIAKALLCKPELLLMDEPFMGLDPPTLVTLSPMLGGLASRSQPSLVLGLRPQDPIPHWITDLVILGRNNTVITKASKEVALYQIYCWARAYRDSTDVRPREREMEKGLTAACGPPPFEFAEILRPSGIYTFTAVRNIYELMRSKKDADGLLLTDHLNKFEQAQVAHALSIPQQDRTVHQLFNLTTLTDHGSWQARQAHLQRIDKATRKVSAEKSKRREVQNISSPEPRATSPCEPLIALNSIIVKYGDKVVLGHPPVQPGYINQGLNLKISRGTRLLLLGPNGSGKTTLLSLLTSDHPQSYSLPIKFFGRTRLPSLGKPGLSLWEIQSRIGHSSPEVHAFFPRSFTVRQTFESAWADTFSSKPNMTEENHKMVDHFLDVWKSELCQNLSSSPTSDTSHDWASDKIHHPAFGRLSFGTQRLLLLLRAIIKQPDIIILDEAFSGLPTETRDKALGWLERGDRSLPNYNNNAVIFPGLTDEQALVVVSHVREEVPSSIDEFVRLPSEEEALEQGRTVQLGSAAGITTLEGWNKVWSL